MSRIYSKRLKANYWYVILSEALLLFLLAAVGLLLLKANRLFNQLKESIDIVVELKNGVDQNNFRQLKTYVIGHSNVIPDSYNFISKEKGAELLEEEFGEEFVLLGITNPLYDVVTFNMKAPAMTREQLEAVTNRVKQFDVVNNVYYEPSVFNYIADNLRWFALTTLAIGLILVVVVMVLIHNTVKLALHANRFLIKNMQLVGASRSFITRPYLSKSIWNGVISAFIALVLLCVSIYFLMNSLPNIDLIRPIEDFILLIVVIFTIGITINLLSTYSAVKRYLKVRVDDLY